MHEYDFKTTPIKKIFIPYAISGEVYFITVILFFLFDVKINKIVSEFVGMFFMQRKKEEEKSFCFGITRLWLVIIAS